MTLIACQNYPDACIALTYLPGTSAALTMDAATPTCFAYSFVVPSNPFGSGSCKLVDIKWSCTTATGSPKVTAYLVPDANSVPDVLANALATATETGVISAGWVTCTFGTPYTLTAGTQYWVVLVCTSGTSAAITYQYSASNISGISSGVIGGSPNTGWRALGDSGTGAAWAGTDRNTVCGIRIGLTNDTDTAYFGYPISASSVGKNSTGYRVDASQEIGFVYTTPANATLSVKSVAFYVRKVGSPGNCSMKLYTGDETTATATSNAVSAAGINTSGAIYTFDFATALTLTGGTKYRFVLSAASGSNSTNYYYTMVSTMDSDSVSGGTVNLIPGSIALTTFISSTWAEEYTSVPANVNLILNTTGRFVAPDFPAVGNVTEDDTVNGSQGTYHEATAAEVQSGVQFGADGTEFTGEYTGGVAGGGAMLMGS